MRFRLLFIFLLLIMQINAFADGSIAAKSNVEDCSVYVDGKYIGKTPIEYVIPSGEHLVVITKEFFKPYQEQVFVSDDKVIVVAAFLKKNVDLGHNRETGGLSVLGKGTLTVRTKPSFGSKVYAEDQFLFETPGTRDSISAGIYNIRISYDNNNQTADTVVKAVINNNKSTLIFIDWEDYFNQLHKIKQEAYLSTHGSLLLNTDSVGVAVEIIELNQEIPPCKIISDIPIGNYKLRMTSNHYQDTILQIEIKQNAICRINYLCKTKMTLIHPIKEPYLPETRIVNHPTTEELSHIKDSLKYYYPKILKGVPGETPISTIFIYGGIGSLIAAGGISNAVPDEPAVDVLMTVGGLSGIMIPTICYLASRHKCKMYYKQMALYEDNLSQVIQMRTNTEHIPDSNNIALNNAANQRYYTAIQKYELDVKNYDLQNIKRGNLEIEYIPAQ